MSYSGQVIAMCDNSCIMISLNGGNDFTIYNFPQTTDGTPAMLNGSNTGSYKILNSHVNVASFGNMVVCNTCYENNINFVYTIPIISPNLGIIS
jgi:hypothetical protein